jgi:hypothetical protein
MSNSTWIYFSVNLIRCHPMEGTRTTPGIVSPCRPHHCRRRGASPAALSFRNSRCDPATRYVISVDAISVVWSVGTGRPDLGLWALGRWFAAAVVLCLRFRQECMFDICCSVWILGIGSCFLRFSVLILLGSDGKLKSGIVCVSLIAVFYAEFDVNGRVLG